MQKILIEVNLAQLGSLPLPPATLVIDMRGVGEDEVIKPLRTEVRDLADELKIHDLHHWRYLTDFLSFRAIPSSQAQNTQSSNQVNQKPFAPPFQENQGGKSFGVFQQDIEEIALEIDRIRNNRIVAVADLGKAGVPGQSVSDTTVRIIFLTDVKNKESLTDAASYAAHLKEHFKKVELNDYQPMVSTTVVCLENSGEVGPPADLIQGLLWNGSWEHIDYLIVSEKYSDNAARIAGATQTYIAELLLYVLLLIPPFLSSVSPFITTETTPTLLLPAHKGGTQSAQPGKWVTLPLRTFLVGLAAVEHSARWGRRWLNYGLVLQAVEVLQNRTAEDEPEYSIIKNTVNSWLREWRELVEQAVPQKIPSDIPGLKAIPYASGIAKPPTEAFMIKRFSFGIGQTTATDLDTYLANLTSTYTLPQGAQARLSQGAQTTSTKAGGQSTSLQHAIDSIPTILQRLRDWDKKDPALKKGAPLAEARLEAQRILSHKSFFTGDTGAVPRARAQLMELGTATAEFQDTHQQRALDLDLTSKKEDLEKRGKTPIDELKKHIEKIPRLGTVSWVKSAMAVGTLVLAFLLMLLIALFGLLLAEHIAFVKVPDSNFFSFLNTGLYEGLSLPSFEIWGIVLLFIGFALAFLRQVLPNKNPWHVELSFWLALIIFAATAFLFSLSLGLFAGDPGSFMLLSWLASSPYAAAFAIILALTILISEWLWFRWWLAHLRHEREAIINDLRTQHLHNIDEVTQFIADTVALELLQIVGLTDGKGGPGSYYDRVDQLYNRFNDVLGEAKDQKDLATTRLALSLSETQPGVTSSNGAWLNLRIRDERLDVGPLVAAHKRLGDTIGKGSAELKEFAEVLLRIMGEETAIEVEQQFRDAKDKTLSGGNREQRQVQVLMETLAALGCRFSIEEPSVDSMTPITERYENINSHHIHQLLVLRILMARLQKKVTKTTIQPMFTGRNSIGQGQILISPADLTREDIALATDSLAAWAQLLWQNKDRKLDQVLAEEGVLPKLMHSGYDPQAVMRQLQANAALFGRTTATQEKGKGYLLLAPSTQSREFRQSLNIPSRLITDFPDIERLLVLYALPYTAQSVFIPDPPVLPSTSTSRQPGTPTTPATLTVSPSSLPLNIPNGITRQVITIGNMGSEPLNWTAALDAGAPSSVSLSTGSGTNLAGGTDTKLEVVVNTTGMTSGSPVMTNLNINAIEVSTGKLAVGSPSIVPITINVVPVAMKLSATHLPFMTTSGSNPAVQSIDLTNMDSNQLDWRADTPSQSWLTVTPTSGSELPGATSSVTFSVDTTGLPAGSHYATVTFVPSVGAPVAVTVTLVIA